jgi:6-phosphogluconolactonase
MTETTSTSNTGSAAATFVYIANADDGAIGSHRLLPDGTLQPGPGVNVGKSVGSMAVSPDRRFLYAAMRSEPFAVHAYAIDSITGALQPLSEASVPENPTYISLDRSGRFLFMASYAGNVVSVSSIGADGRIGAQPFQSVPVGRAAHSVRTDESNRYVYVPTLGSDQLFQFSRDATTGRIASNTPAVVQLKAGTGPRHFVTSKDNRFLYVLSELLGSVSTFTLDAQTGLLTEIATVSMLAPDSKLRPGIPRGAAAPAGSEARSADNDIWAADLHLTPDGRFLFASERTSSTLAAFAVEAGTGTLTYRGSTPTEAQPRGFAIDPSGRYLVAVGERSQTISLYSIDPAGGVLTPLRKYPGGRGANWVEMVALD